MLARLRRLWQPTRQTVSALPATLPHAASDLRRLELSSHRHLAGLLRGERHSRLRGQGLEFHGLRPYQPGDDPRQLDWNVTARSAQPHIREYQQERNANLLLLADISPSLGPAERKLQYDAVALLAFAAVANHDRVGLIAFSDRVEQVIPPAASSAHVRRLLHNLHRLPASGVRSDPTAALELVPRLLKRTGMVILLSDFHFTLPQRPLMRVAVRHDLLGLLLHQPESIWNGAAGLLAIRDRESGAERLIACDGENSRLATAWQLDRRRKLAELSRHQVDAAALTTGSSPLPHLKQLFRQRRV